MIYFQLLIRLLRYFFRAKTKFDVHSPFVYEFTQLILEDKRTFYAFPIIKSLRAYLKKEETLLQMHDLGAGSKVDPTPKQRRVGSIVRSSAVGAYSGKILFRAVHLYKPKHILELGTSLGISTLYQSYGALKSQITTIEGNPAVAEVAAKNFKRFQIQNIRQKIGNFDDLLEPILKEQQSVDFFFVDGNHTKEATLRYFEQALAHANPDSVFVFGDIHWSREMEEAWKAIQAHSAVSLSIDLFYLGFVFFRTEQQHKEHFTLIPSRFKPWRMGFWS